jgi:hypothetical protein
LPLNGGLETYVASPLLDFYKSHSTVAKSSHIPKERKLINSKPVATAAGNPLLQNSKIEE